MTSPMEEIRSALSRSKAALDECYGESKRSTPGLGLMMIASVRAARAAKSATDLAHGSFLDDKIERDAWLMVAETQENSAKCSRMIVDVLDADRVG